MWPSKLLRACLPIIPASFSANCEECPQIDLVAPKHLLFRSLKEHFSLLNCIFPTFLVLHDGQNDRPNS